MCRILLKGKRLGEVVQGNPEKVEVRVKVVEGYLEKGEGLRKVVEALF
ncbi:hypothetical protein [Bacillus sp. CHD6a]|nr:hypothetical protein [Bacillus sp. CHD6a]